MTHLHDSVSPTPSSTDRDVLGSVALAAAGVSLLGLVVLVVGHLLDPADFNNGPHPAAANNVAFFAYVLGLLVALLLGGAVWFYGRRSGRVGPRSSAALATYAGVVLLLAGVVGTALGG